MVFIENIFWQVTVNRNDENKKELIVKITLTSLSGINPFLETSATCEKTTSFSYSRSTIYTLANFFARSDFFLLSKLN